MKNSDSRSLNSSKNIIIGLINKVVILCLTFVSRKIFIKYLGVEYLGINGLFTNVLTLLSMADLGFGVAMNYSFYKPLAQKDDRTLAALITFYKKIYHYIAVGVGIIGISIIPLLKYIINTKEVIPNLTLYYLIFLANTVVSYLFVYKSSIISADQKNHIVSRLSIYVTIAKIILQLVTIILLKNYIAFISLNVAATIINNLIISYIADKLYPFIKQKYLLGENEKRELIENMKAVFLYKIATSFLTGIDSIAISIIVGTVYVGFYSNYQTITSNLTAFVTIAFISLTASIGNLIVKESPEARYKVFNTLQTASLWMSGVLAVCLYVLVQDFITLWLGNRFLLDQWSVVALVISIYFMTSMQPIFTYREATGLYRQTKHIMLLAAVLNIILAIILGRPLGITGIIIASVLSRLLTYFWYEPKLLFRQYFHRTVTKYYGTYFENLALVIFSAYIIQKLLARIEAVNGAIWVIKAMICFVFINIIYFLRYFNTEEFKYFLIKIRSLKE